MTKRAFVGGLFHEANAFSPIPAPLEVFEVAPRARIEEDLQTSQESGQWAGYTDFLNSVRSTGWAALPGFYAMATPSAPCSAQTYLQLKNQLLESLKASMPIDAVCLFLHGAQTADGFEDCAGDIAASVRAVVGPHVRIGVLLDLHANVHPKLLEAADLVQACKEYPHTDFGDTARQIWQRLVSDIPIPRPVWHAVPIFPAATTVDGPLRDFVETVRQREGKKGVRLSAVHGFPHADVAHASAGILGYGLTGSDVAQIAEGFFNAALSASKAAPGMSIRDVVSAIATAKRPIIIAERSDNPGAGGAGDATHVLRALREHFPDQRIGAALLHDPSAVAAAHAAGQGATLSLKIGGAANALSGPPLDLLVTVRSIRADASQPYFGDGGAMSLGRSALLQAGNTFMVANTIRQQPFAPGVFTAHGLDPEWLDIIILKSTNHFYGAFAPLAGTILYCDAPGAASEDLRAFPYKNLSRPVWPLDTEDVCRAALKSSSRP